MNLSAEASRADTNTRAIFVLAARLPPYAVYCNPFYTHAGHGTIFTPSSPSDSASSSSSSSGPHPGCLSTATIQHYPYQPDSGIHGMVFDPPTETYLYSADLKTNKIWVHRRRNVAAAAASSPPHGSAAATAATPAASLQLVGSISCPNQHDHPRWVAMHPSGKYLYALMEKGNRICEYVIDPETHMPVYTHRAYPLIPPGIPDKHRWTMYRADVCALSHSGKYLFASSRANSFDLTGYIAAFKLDDARGGAIERQICLNPTLTSGGHSNALTPSDWCDDWLAIVDDQEGWLEVYRWHDEFLARVARIRVPEPGFGMNAIWYD